MEILQYILKIIRKNLLLAIILVVAGLASGFIHYKSQTTRYVSQFTMTKGKMDYVLLRELVVFDNLNQEVYGLEESQLNDIKSRFSEFTISYISGSENSLMFTLVTNNPNVDHIAIQDDLIILMNNNKFIQNSIEEEVVSLELKRSYLTQKIAQLDSISTNTDIIDLGDNPLNSYTLFEQKVEIEKMINQSGKFKLIKPILKSSPSKRPLMLFEILYLVIAGFLFLLLSKKKFS